MVLTLSPHGALPITSLLKVQMRRRPISKECLWTRPPRGGIPGADLEPGGGIVARAPVYGTGDAGRKFWQKVKQDFLAAGFTLNRIMNALFSIAKDGDILGMCGTHVDDFLYGVRCEAIDIMQRVLDGFGVQDTEDTSFRYCGKELLQSEDFSIKVTCRDTTEKLHPIRYDSMPKLCLLYTSDAADE